MILVIFGHLGLNSVTDYQCYASFIKLPLFFVASGFVFNPKKTKDTLLFLKTRIQRILLPYFYLCFVICLINLILYRQDITTWLKDSLLSVFTGTIYMWFLPVLFLCNVVMFFVFKFVKGKNIPIIVSAVLSLILGYILIPEKPIPFSVNEVLIAYPFCILGYYLKTTVLKWNNKILIALGSISLLLFFALPLVYMHFNGSMNYINMKENHYSLFFYDILIALCGVIGIFLLIRYFKIPKPVSWFGRNTIFYYAFHIPACNAIIILLGMMIPVITTEYLKSSCSHIALYCFITIVSLILLAPLCLLVNKYIPQLVGNKKQR